MKSKDLKPLKVSLHGMDERMRKMMEYYFKLPCKGAAIVVDDDEAHVEIVDVDLSLSKSLLEERLAQQPSKPIIAFSLNEISTSGVIYVKKPIDATDVLVAFGVAKDVILGKISLKRTDKPVDTSSKISNLHELNETKTPRKTRLESNKVVSDIITEARQKFKAIRKLASQQDYLQGISHKKFTFYYIKQKKKVLRSKESESLEQQKLANDEHATHEKPIEKRQASPETHENSTTQDEIATRSNAFLVELWRRKSLITGLACLFIVIAGIYIFQSMPIYEGKAQIYEARAQVFISNNKPEHIDVNSSIPEDPLDLNKVEAQKKINEIASRLLAGRVINTLQLNTIPEFIVASASSQEQALTSKFGDEQQAAEQLKNMTDYFLQNLKVAQFKNTPIINIDYKAKDPELAAIIVNQLAREYRAMQQYKKIEMENKLAEQETNELPIANQKSKKITTQTRSATVSGASINFANVNTNGGNGGNANSNAGTTGPASGRTMINKNATTGGTATSGDGIATGGGPFANEKVITSMVGNSSDAATIANVNTLSTGNIIQNVTNGSDFGEVISKATASTLTTGNFTQSVENGDNFAGMVSNQLNNVGINNPKVGGVNITTQVGSISVNP